MALPAKVWRDIAIQYKSELKQSLDSLEKRVKKLPLSDVHTKEGLRAIREEIQATRITMEKLQRDCDKALATEETVSIMEDFLGPIRNR